MELTFDEINDATGFANGEPFTNELQVWDYFTVENQRMMFGDAGIQDARLLAQMAVKVIANRWNCRQPEGN